MPREPLELTGADMAHVVALVEAAPDSLASAAHVLGVPRTYLYRLMHRVNVFLGDKDIPWRRGNDFTIPVEVRRIAPQLKAVLHQLQNDTGRFPRVACGSMAAILLERVRARADVALPRMMTIRSADALSALRSGSIDLVVLHELRGEIPGPEFESVPLLPWRGVIVRPVASLADAFTLRIVRWEKGSFADLLQHRVSSSLKTWHALPNGPIGYSYLSALELIRRGTAITMAVPDIYVVRHDLEVLELQYPPDDVTGVLQAVFRRAERERLAPLLQVAVWQAVADEAHMPSRAEIQQAARLQRAPTKKSC
jgi:hypothetical protein